MTYASVGVNFRPCCDAVLADYSAPQNEGWDLLMQIPACGAIGSCLNYLQHDFFSFFSSHFSSFFSSFLGSQHSLHMFFTSSCEMDIHLPKLLSHYPITPGFHCRSGTAP